METFSALLALCAGNSPVPVNSPHKGQWRGALMFSLICAWINNWVNNHEADDLRRRRGHYDVNVMRQQNDDVMETLSALLTVCEGIPPVESPHKGSVMQGFDVLFIVSLNKLLNKLLSCQ